MKSFLLTALRWLSPKIGWAFMRALLVGGLLYAYGITGTLLMQYVLQPITNKVVASTQRAQAVLVSISGGNKAHATTTVRYVSVPQPLPFSVDNNNPCVIAIRQAAEKHGVPVDVMLEIGHNESRFSPYAVMNNAGFKSNIFKNQKEALQYVQKQRTAGNNNMDVGCMQVNLKHHPSAFATAEEAFTAISNADYAARFIARLYKESGDWRAASLMYHSRTPEKQALYAKGLNNSRAVLTANDKAKLNHLIAQNKE